MSSFTKQLRTGAFSLENLTEEDAQATLAEPLADDVNEVIEAPTEEIAEGADALVEADADASTLENTAQILEDASGDGAQDVDVATSELANITVEAMSRKYGLRRSMKLSKESFSDAKTRKGTAKSLAKEAMDSAKELGNRIVEGIKKLVEWFKNMIQSVFDKRAYLEKRFSAIAAAAAGVKAESKGNIKLAGYGVVKGGAVVTNPLELLNVAELNEVIKGFSYVEDLAKSATADFSGQTSNDGGQDLNPKQFNGTTLKSSVNNGKLVVTKEQVEKPEAKEVDAMKPADLQAAAKNGLAVLKNFQVQEAYLKRVLNELTSASSKVKAVVTGSDNGEKADRGNILARYSAVSKLAGSISAIVLATLMAGADACEKSLAAHKKAEGTK